MDLKCAAIDHGICFFPNEKIAPCTKIDYSYHKDQTELFNHEQHPWDDLNKIIAETNQLPSVCRACIDDEHYNIPSYRQGFNLLNDNNTGWKFLDIRQSNVCNLACRMCDSRFSNTWGKIVNQDNVTTSIDIKSNLLELDLSNLIEIYFAGGEPMLNLEHWKLLEKLIAQGNSKDITLRYSTNLTTLKYKNTHIFDLWKHFKQVCLSLSIDGIGPVNDNVRSRSKWSTVESNLNELIDSKLPNLNLTMVCTVSILNVWFLNEIIDFSASKKISISFVPIEGPDFLSCSVVPTDLKPQLLSIIKKTQSNNNVNQTIRAQLNKIEDQIVRNYNESLFIHTIAHILLLDKLNNENMFDLLPIKDITTKLILTNGHN